MYKESEWTFLASCVGGVFCSGMMIGFTSSPGFKWWTRYICFVFMVPKSGIGRYGSCGLVRRMCKGLRQDRSGKSGT